MRGLSLEPFTTLALNEDSLKYFIGRERMITDMGNLILDHQNFGITGAPGTGKTTILNILKKNLMEQKVFTKVHKIISFNFTIANSADFLKRFLFILLENLEPKDISKINLRKISDDFLFTTGLQEFLRSLVRYEPTKELDSYQILRLYSDFIKTELKEKDASKVISFISPENLLFLIVKILKNLKKHVVFFVDDMDKVIHDPLTNNTSEDRLASLLFELKDLMELSQTTWVFTLPINFYEKYKINPSIPQTTSFLGIFSDIFLLHNFSRKRTVEMFRVRLESSDFKGKIIDFIDSYALNLLLDLSRGNPRLFLYFLRKAYKYKEECLKRGETEESVPGNETGKEKTPDSRIKINHILSSIDYIFNLDERNKKILAYIAYKQKTDSNDHGLQETTGLDRLAINRRLKELTENGILDYFLDQYGKRIYITKKLT
ncbi:MAG TPA: ATP-binding protein [Firmicutes bacterium]|nr:ATP-binding protein [Bacillota bacterium]